MTYTLHHGDCLDILPTLPSGSIDAIIADPPYGTTACKWDSVIPLEAMWRELKRVIKPRGAVVLFAAQPFTSALVMSNAGWFKYDLVWRKVRITGHLDAKRKPLREHEEVLLFCNGQPTYNPQMTQGVEHIRGPFGKRKNGHSTVYKPFTDSTNVSDKFYPRSTIELRAEMQPVHPTQKPVDLLRYLIRTYTNPGETVLDFCYGSGTTGVAALIEGRNFVGIEKDADYYALGARRIEQVQPALMEAAD